MFNRSRSLIKSVLIILTLGLLLLPNLSAYAQDPNFHIYLCFGQSNMEGNGVIEAQDKTGVDSRFQVLGAVTCYQNGKSYTLGKWQTALPPIFRCYTGLSPVDYFGRTMVANLPSTIKVGVVPVAVGGSAIELFDKVNYGSYVATAPGWMVSYINEYGGNPYGRLVEVAKLAQKQGVIKGILLHQGESNNGQTDWPLKVKAIYNNLIKDLGLDPAKTPLLVGELARTEEGGVCGGHNKVIATVPGVIPNSFVISSQGLPQKGDGLHFTPASYRTLGQRYAQKMLSLLPKSNPPLVTITQPLNNASFTSLQPVTLAADASDADGKIVRVDFFDGTTKVGSDSVSPYTITLASLAAGTHSLTAVATDNSGAVSTSVPVTIEIKGAKAPYNALELKIPGRIEAEYYDLGGEGISYHEAEASGNQGGADLRKDQVDIETSTDAGGGYNIGYVLQGEWLDYTVHVAATAAYSLSLRVAADGTGKALHLEIDGQDISGKISIPNTGGWQNWQSSTAHPLQLTQGVHTMRLAFDSDYLNINYLDFASSVTSVEDHSSGSSFYPNPYTAEGFRINMPGVFTYQILNNNGVVLEEGKGYQTSIIGTSLPSGNYILKIIQESSCTIHKIVRL